MNNNQFLYLLGAGASAGSISSYGDDSKMNQLSESFGLNNEIKQVIPTVYDMRRRIKIMYDYFNNNGNIKFKAVGDVSHEMIQRSYHDLIIELKWFYHVLGREPFVDILAETLYMTNKTEFLRLKSILSIYIILEQCFNGVDIRYKTFITTLLSLTKSPEKFPNCVNVMTYNYDYQIEEAIAEKRGYFDSQKIFDFICKFIYIREWETLSTLQENVSNEFPLIKINGFAPAYKKKVLGGNNYYIEFPYIIPEATPYLNEKHMQDEAANLPGRIGKLMSQVLCLFTKYKQYSGSYFPAIHFAWENSNSEFINHIKKMQFLKQCNTLISIGYSFPSLNAAIDREIFKNGNINKVYVQCLEKDFDLIEQRIKYLSKRDLEIICIYDFNDFFIPFELQETLLDSY